MSESRSCPHQGVCSTVPAEAHFRAVAAYSGLAALRSLTINHRNVGLGALSDAAVASDHAAALHQALSANGIESLVLATCNRTELYWRARVPGDDEAATRAFLEATGGTRGGGPVPTRLHGRAAADHLFRVCAGLESLVLGEAEILGQVRAALDACSGAGPFLTGVVQAALRTGRLARAETAIGVGAMSVASAAVKLLAGQVALARSRVLVIGAGATGLKVARHLRALGVRQIVLANRTVERAEAEAATLGATAVSLDHLADELALADAVIGAAAAPGLLVTAADLDAAVARRDGRLLVTIDLSMPPVLEPAERPGIVRLDLHAIERHVAEQRERRAAEVPRVEAVIERELGFLHAWARQQALRPLVSDLRRKVEAIRRAELDRVQQELGDAAAVDPAILERLSRRLLDQVLALPLASLENGGVPLDPTQAQYVRRLFALDHTREHGGAA